MCTENAGDMIRDVHLADTLVEVVRGGDGGLLVESASTAAFETLYEAIAAAANIEPEEEEEEEEEEEKEGGEKVSALMTRYCSHMLCSLSNICEHMFSV
jgi:antitoxin component of MazEF toxin-antitoxin module